MTDISTDITIGEWVTDVRPDTRRTPRRGLVKLVEGGYVWVYWPNSRKIARMSAERLRPSPQAPQEGGAS